MSSALSFLSSPPAKLLVLSFVNKNQTADAIMAPKQPDQQLSAVNGAGGHSTPQDNQNNSSAAPAEKSTYGTAKSTLVQDRPLKTDREGVTDAFTQFGQLIHASRRPLPTQMGDGTYNEQKTRTGLRQDLRRLRLKGAKHFKHGVLVTTLTLITRN